MALRDSTTHGRAPLALDSAGFGSLSYVDGLGVVLRARRARRVRRELADVGLTMPKILRVDSGSFAVTLGCAPVARDLAGVAALLQRFDARVVRLEIARDLALDSDHDPEEELDELLERTRLRTMPERDWYQPPGFACRYLGPAEQPLNGCAYVLESSKRDARSGPVAHIEVRWRSSELRARGLNDPRRIIPYANPAVARSAWRESFTVARPRRNARHASCTRAYAVGTPSPTTLHRHHELRENYRVRD